MLIESRKLWKNVGLNRPHDSSLVSCASDIIIGRPRRPAPPARRAQYAALEAMDEDEARRAQQRERARQTLQAAFLQLYQVRARVCVCVARALEESILATTR